MLKIEYVKTAELKPYGNNAKLHPAEQVEQIKKSIQEFGFNDPIAVWKDNEIIEGHGRLIAADELGITNVPVIRLDNLSDEERRAYMLVHNQLTMNSGFDKELLEIELNGLNVDMAAFGFKSIEEELNEAAEYNDKTDRIQYEPDENTCGLWECFDNSKTKALIEKINQSDVDETEKEFLRLAAQRHVVFNYGKIAGYYANANVEMQTLMEESALIIIDYDDAIKYGYTKLHDFVKENMG